MGNESIAVTPLTFLKSPYSRLVGAFALFYGACISFYYRSWAFGAAVDDVSVSLLLNVAIVVTSALVVAAGATRLLARGLEVVLVGAALLAMASVCAWLGIAGKAPGYYEASMLLAGFGMGIAQPYLYEAFVRFGHRRLAVAYGIVAALGMLLALAAQQFGTEGLLIANLCFLGGSCLLLAGLRREGLLCAQSFAARFGETRVSESVRQHRRTVIDRLVTAAVVVLAVSLLYGALSSTATTERTPRDVSASMAQVSGLLVGLMFVAVFGLFRFRPSTTFFNGALGVLGAPVLLLPFLSSAYPALLYAFSSAAWKLMLLVFLYQVAVADSLGRRERVAGLAVACALPRLGVSAGSLLAHGFRLGVESDFMRLAAIAVVLLYLLFMAVWFVNSHERRRAERRAQAADAVIERVSRTQEDVRFLQLDALAQTSRLTNREREVLSLMARGRDLAYICEELCLARNTVKGYQKSIYAKLGVHSKQELIDLVHSA